MIWWIGFGLFFFVLIIIGAFNFLSPVASIIAQVAKFQPNGHRLALGSTRQLDLRYVGRPGGLQFCFPEESNLSRFLQDVITHNTDDEHILIMGARQLHDGATLTAIEIGGGPRTGSFASHVRVHSVDHGDNGPDCWLSNWYYFKNVHVSQK